jgi:uncharacterized membrane protein
MNLPKKKIAKYILARSKEPSTWRGVAMLVAAAGIGLTPGQVNGLVEIGMFAAGALGALVPDDLTKRVE